MTRTKAKRQLQPDASKLSGDLQSQALRFHPHYCELIRALISSENHAGELGDRDLLRLSLSIALSGVSGDRPNFPGGKECVFVPMPADLAWLIFGALRALDAGEVPSIFTPAPTIRRDNPHTADRLKLDALVRVNFLVGAGIGKAAARRQVEDATGIAVDTLRDWEREIRKDTTKDSVLQTAEQYGRLQPSPTESPIWRMLGLDETLDEFGARYRGLRKLKHWGGGQQAP